MLISVSLIFACVATAAGPSDADIPSTALLADRFDRLVASFQSFRLLSRVWTLDDHGRHPSGYQESFVDGGRRRYHVVHNPPNTSDASLAAFYDIQVNDFSYDGACRTVYYGNLREATIDPEPLPAPTTYTLADHLQGLFLSTAASRVYLDKPMAFKAPDGFVQRCRWRDLLLPEALRLPGWTRDRAEEGRSAQPAAIVLSRQIAPRFRDRLWLDPNRGYALVSRRWDFGAGESIIYDYDDVRPLVGDLWMAYRTHWTTGSKRFERTVEELQFGPPDPDRLGVRFAAGTKVTDNRSGKIHHTVGGDDMVDEVVERFRGLYALPIGLCSPRRMLLASLTWWAAVFSPLVLGAMILRQTMRQSAVKASRRRAGQPAGFTLIEILVVIAVIGILVALLIPAVQRAREASRRMGCANNLRQLGLGLSQYAGVHGQYPSGNLPGGGRSAFVSITPFLEARSIFDGFNFDVYPLDLANMTVELARPGIFVCPSDAGTQGILPGGPGLRGPVDPPDGSWPTALTSYGLMYGSFDYPYEARENPDYDPNNQINGCFNEMQSIRPADITDGLSQTIFGSERALGFVNANRIRPYGNWTGSLATMTLVFTWLPPNAVFQYRSNPYYWSSLGPGKGISSMHGGGVNALFGDSSVRFIKETIDCWPIDPEVPQPAGLEGGFNGFGKTPRLGIWQALSTRAGGEVIGEY